MDSQGNIVELTEDMKKLLAANEYLPGGLVPIPDADLAVVEKMNRSERRRWYKQERKQNKMKQRQRMKQAMKRS